MWAAGGKRNEQKEKGKTPVVSTYVQEIEIYKGTRNMEFYHQIKEPFILIFTISCANIMLLVISYRF